MEASKCTTTVTARFKADQTDTRTMPAPRTYTCDKPGGDWHEIHHDPDRGDWRASISAPRGTI